MNEFLVIAHRGNSSEHLENSPSAFKSAIKLGADMIETDVQKSKDGELFLMHDKSITRCTNFKGKISKLNSNELRRITLKNGEPIWTVDELLDECNGKIKVNLEIKARRIEETVLNIVKKHDMLEDVVFTNFNMNSMLKIKRLEPNSRVGWLTIFRIPYLTSYILLNRLTRAGCEALCPVHEMVNENLVRTCHEKKLKIYTWTVNDVP